MRTRIRELEAVGNEIAAGRAAGLRSQLDRLTGAVKRRLGVTIDVDRLDDDERNELWRLGERVLGRGGWEDHDAQPFALSRLDKGELARFQALIGKAAGEPGLFERVKEDESIRRRLVELARRARPAERVVVKEPGAIALPAVLFELVRGGEPALNFVDLGLLVAVATSLENGHSVFYSGRIEGEGDERTLVLPRQGGTGYHEPPDCHINVSRSCRRLAEHGLLTFVEQGGERQLGAGPRLLGAWSST